MIQLNGANIIFRLWVDPLNLKKIQIDFDGTLYVDGDWSKAGWKKRLEELIGKKLSKKEWKKLRHKSVCVVATKGAYPKSNIMLKLYIYFYVIP